jgi:predicted transcriptional regulator
MTERTRTPPHSRLRGRDTYLRLPSPLKAAVEAAALRLDITQAELIRRAVADYLARL